MVLFGSTMATAGARLTEPTKPAARGGRAFSNPGYLNHLQTAKAFGW